MKLTRRGQLVQTTCDDAPPAAPAAPAAVDTPGDSAPPADAPPAAPAPSEEAPPDSAPDGPTSPPDPTEDEDDEAPEPVPRSVQRRIDRERRLRGDAERKQAAMEERARLYEERLRMYEQGFRRPAAPEPPAAPPSPASVVREDYATDEEWIQAVTSQAIAREREQWQLEQLRLGRSRNSRPGMRSGRPASRRLKRSIPTTSSGCTRSCPDWRPSFDRGWAIPTWPPSWRTTWRAIRTSLQRLNGLQPLALSRALGRLEQQLTVPSRPPSPPPTAKPAPPTPLNGAGSPGPRLLTDLSDSEIESLSLAEYDALYKRQFPRSR